MTRVDVRVVGAGLVGRALARRLRAEGVEVWLEGVPGEATDLDPLPVALPCHPEHPWRFLAAVGRDTGRTLVAFAAAGLARTPGLVATGVTWPSRGPEAPDAARSVEACAALGLAAHATDEGFRLLGGGLVDRAALDAALPGPDPVDGPPPDAELVVLAPTFLPPPEAGGFLDDTLTPARWHAVGWADPGAPAAEASRQATVFAWVGGGARGYAGARWAEPHLGIGDREAEPPSARVIERLAALARQDRGVEAPPAWARAWVTGESCDGLPIVGPLPGRPRVLVATGLGVATLTYGVAVAEAVADGLLGRDGLAVPAVLSAGRFR